MLGLAVAIDYALFIVHRYRDEIGKGAAPEDAASTAAGTAGMAVVFAGCTVVVALAGLSVTGIPFLTIMGLCAAGTVIVAVLIAVTLIPALLGFAGAKIKPPRTKRAGRGFFARWVAFTTKRAVFVVIAGVLLLLAVASPLLKMDLGLPSAGTLPKSDTARTAYDLLARGFGPGINGPLLVVVDAPARLDPVAVAETATKDLASVPGVASVSPPLQNAAKNVTVVDVIPTTGPSSVATKDLVATIREKSAAVAAPFGVRVLVTGPTALGHRRLGQARSRTPDLPARGGGHRRHPAHAGLPLVAGAAHGGPRVPPHHRRGARASSSGSSRTATSRTSSLCRPRRP